jgi:hypothetical protein
VKTPAARTQRPGKSNRSRSRSGLAPPSAPPGSTRRPVPRSPPQLEERQRCSDATLSDVPIGPGHHRFRSLPDRHLHKLRGALDPRRLSAAGDRPGPRAHPVRLGPPRLQHGWPRHTSARSSDSFVRGDPPARPQPTTDSSTSRLTQANAAASLSHIDGRCVPGSPGDGSPRCRQVGSMKNREREPAT